VSIPSGKRAMTCATCASMGVCADGAYDDIEERGDDPVDPTDWWDLFDRLPECTYNESTLWR